MVEQRCECSQGGDSAGIPMSGSSTGHGKMPAPPPITVTSIPAQDAENEDADATAAGIEQALSAPGPENQVVVHHGPGGPMHLDTTQSDDGLATHDTTIPLDDDDSILLTQQHGGDTAPLESLTQTRQDVQMQPLRANNQTSLTHVPIPTHKGQGRTQHNEHGGPGQPRMNVWQIYPKIKWWR